MGTNYFSSIYTRKMVPITGRANSFLEIETSISIQIISNPFFSFLSSSVSMANLSHLVDTMFSSLALHSSSVSTANLATTFSSLSFLSNSVSSHRFNLLRVARRCFSWSYVSDDLLFFSYSFWVILLALSFSSLILSLSFICSSVSEALFALSF